MTVWLFPGQGTQKVGMGRELVEASAAAAAVFAQADAALNEPFTQLVFEGPAEALTATANAQPAILTASIAALAALKEAHPELEAPRYAAGHSLGEYSALVASGALSFEDAIRVVRLRGEAMQRAVAPGVGAMAAIMGGDAATVQALCDAALVRANDEQESTEEPAVLSPANFNAPGQVVIAGHSRAVEAARSLASDHKLKAIPLKVSAPFHCSLMAPAAKAVADALANVSLHDPKFPVVANVSAQPNTLGAAVRDLLIRQVDGPVRWQETMFWLREQGETEALEIGPGKVLAGLAKRCKPSLSVRGVFSPESLAEAIPTSPTD